MQSASPFSPRCVYRLSPNPSLERAPFMLGPLIVSKRPWPKRWGHTQKAIFWDTIHWNSIQKVFTNMFYSVPSSLLSPTGCEGALQRHGGPHRRSHTHVCCLLLWVRTGQEAAAENPQWYSHVGLSAVAKRFSPAKAVWLIMCNDSLQVSTAVCCRHVVRGVHHGHHGSRRAHQMPPTGQRSSFYR